MHTQLFIPKTITVGFQKRTDTFTGKLAYIIYTDEKGKLRKETSWQSWRDSSIDSLTFDNDPTPNFTFNKGVRRDGHWGSGRSVIRVWDPRDFEFEVSVDNLIGLLMHSDVSKRDIVESCVYAWHGTELILLPTNSIEYEESVKHTAKQSKKVSAKELVVGYSYGVKKENLSVVYLGYYERYVSDNSHAVAENDYYRRGPERFKFQNKLAKKQHMFIDPVTKEVYAKNPSSWLATIDMEEMHPDFAALNDVYFASLESQPIVGMTIVPIEVHAESYAYSPLYWQVKGWVEAPWFALSDTEFVQIALGQYNYHNAVKTTDPAVKRFAKYHPDINKLEFSYDASVPEKHSYYNYHRQQQWAANEFEGLSKTDVRVAKLLESVVELEHDHGLIKGYDQHRDNTEAGAKSQAERYAELAQKLNQRGAGQLAYALADGKIATDYKL